MDWEKACIKTVDKLAKAHLAIEEAIDILENLAIPLDSRHDYTADQIDEAVCSEAKVIIKILKKGLKK